MITDPWFYAAAVPAVILVGMAKGGFGGAIALLGVPLMSLVISPVQAAGILLPILVVMDLVGLAAYRRRYHLPSLKILIPPAIVGVGIGWLTASVVTEAHVRLIVGVVALAFTLDYFLRGARRPAAATNRIKGSFWATVAGFTSFVSHAGGPPLQMYLLPLRLEPRLFAGTSVIFFAVVNATKLVPYYALDQLRLGNLETSAVLLPLAPLATLTGVWLVKVVEPARFYRITYAAVFVVSFKLIHDGLAGTGLI